MEEDKNFYLTRCVPYSEVEDKGGLGIKSLEMLKKLLLR